MPPDAKLLMQLQESSEVKNVSLALALEGCVRRRHAVISPYMGVTLLHHFEPRTILTGHKGDR
jgi:hypothetical protein